MDVSMDKVSFRMGPALSKYPVTLQKFAARRSILWMRVCKDWS